MSEVPLYDQPADFFPVRVAFRGCEPWGRNKRRHAIECAARTANAPLFTVEFSLVLAAKHSWAGRPA